MVPVSDTAFFKKTLNFRFRKAIEEKFTSHSLNIVGYIIKLGIWAMFLVPVWKGGSLHKFCPRICLLSEQYWIPEPDLFPPLAFNDIIRQTLFLYQIRNGCLFVLLPHTDPEVLMLPTDRLILFTSSPLIYLVSKDEGRIGGSCQS